jgi:hypothetical protein
MEVSNKQQEKEVSLADIRKESKLRDNCEAVGIEYIERHQDETENQKSARHNVLNKEITNRRKNISRRILTPQKRRQVQHAHASAERQRRINLSPEERIHVQDANTAAHQQQRAALSSEEQEHERRSNSASRRQQRAIQQSEPNIRGDDRGCSLVPPDENHVKTLVEEAIKQATRTKRPDGTHQATVCVVCDRVISGDEKVCNISKERLEENRHRLSVDTYESFYGTELHRLLVEQYSVEGLPKILLSPRAYRDGENFECCQSCYSSTLPSRAKKTNKPPKYAIANGFVIGHLPTVIHIPEEDEPRIVDLDLDGDTFRDKFSDLLCTALSTQRSHGFVFAFTGGAQKSVMGSINFFEMDQNFMGSVINQYRSTGANDHLLCVLCGRFTPAQRTIARNKAILDTKLYVDLMTWFIRVSGHPAYRDLTPPEVCPAPRILEDDANENNTDISQNPDVEGEYQGSTFTYTSSSDPTENASTFSNSSNFASAMINQSSPLLLVRGGNYVNANTELKLENVFPIQFPWGSGGPTQHRPTNMSKEAAIQHYTRLSLKQFMRGDFLLVALTMMNRIRSFKTGIMTCRSLGNGQQSFAESISTLTDSQIKKAAENITNKVEDDSVAAQFLRRTETSCRSIGYTAAAAKANRRLMYGLCDRFGIPHIFFTISPCDECSWRVRLWANAGTTMTMPSIDDPDNVCLADYTERRDTRLKYPGACALEYESIIKTLLKKLFGWDCKKQKGSKGIFGTLQAFCVAHEEQGELGRVYVQYILPDHSSSKTHQRLPRYALSILSITCLLSSARKTLHGHWLLWVKELMHWRKELFGCNRDEVRKAFLKFIDSIMSSSYLKDEEMKVDSDCCDKCESNAMVVDIPNHESGDGHIAIDTDSLAVNAKFVDVHVGSEMEQEQLQRIRNTRNKHKKDEIKGKILNCRDCGGTFSTNDIVQMSLRYYKRVAEEDRERDNRLSDDITVQMSSHRLDIACYRLPYDLDACSTSGTSSSYYDTTQVREILMRRRFDEHDFRHRPGCFKKGNECRFHLAKQSCKETTLHVEDVAQHESNVVVWHHLLNESNSDKVQTTPYLVETKRYMGSQFINTHSVDVSNVFACNTNVQMGEPCHLFYASAYAFKDTQKEDTERFIRIGTQVIKRLIRMRLIAIENARLENREPDERVPDFGEGLSMILSGMVANLSKAICSSTMAWLLINSEDGQRFQYSHQFTNVLVNQMEDVLDGKDGHFRIRKNHSKSQNDIVLWPDSSVDDYIYRHNDLDEMSLYEFNAKCKKVYKTFKQMNRTKSNDDATTSASRDFITDEAIQGNEHYSDEEEDDGHEGDGEEEENSDARQSKYPFQQEHPGADFTHLQLKKYETIPVISLPGEGLCRIKDLEIGSTNPSNSAILNRERYAKLSLIMFCPFRVLEDLQGQDDSYWATFETILAHKRNTVDVESSMDVDTLSFYEHGIDILHNIEERKSVQTMKSAVEPVAKRTVYEASEEDDDTTRHYGNEDDDPHGIDFAYFDEDDDRDVDNDTGEAELMGQRTVRSNHTVIDRGGVSADSMIGARLSHQNSLLAEDDNTSATTQEESASNATSAADGSRTYPTRSYPQLISFVQGTIVGGGYEDYTRSLRDEGDDEVAAMEMDPHASDNIFEDNASQIRIPTLQSVALKVAREEGKILDWKQYAAFEIIVSSFLTDTLEKEGMNSTTSALLQLDVDRKCRLLQRLKALGGHSQLIMFLTGFAGAGKSTCVTVARRYCCEFCRVASIPWDDDTFLFTATTGSAASLFGGSTIQKAAFLNGQVRNISNQLRQRWQQVKLLIIDEISFSTKQNIDKLDARLKNIMGIPDKPFGGVSIVFSGDFHQLKPVLNSGTDRVLYDRATNGFFLGSINSAIILEESHRFDDDPEYGNVMKRFWGGTPTVEDIDYINTRLVGKPGVELPSDSIDGDITYACPFNKQRNSISAGIFSNHLRASGDFPPIDTDTLPPDHTIIIEADLRSSTTRGNAQVTRVSPTLKDAILYTCGDADVTVGKSRHVDPCLKLFNGSHVMCNNNDMLTTHNIGNGTIARVKCIKLKTTAPDLMWKNWEGKKVYTVNARHVEYVEIERYPNSPNIDKLKELIHELETNTTLDDASHSNDKSDRLATLQKDLVVAQRAQCVKVKPTKSSAKVTVQLTGDTTGANQQKLSGVGILQLPLMMNDATTGHKLQGMSKNKLVVVSWNMGTANWVYVVLSRVRTLNGLYLLKPLPRDCLDKFQVPADLIVFEQHMRDLERTILTQRDNMMRDLDSAAAAADA